MTEPAERHDHHQHDLEQLGLALLTVSSSRSLEDDPAGDAAAAAATEAGHDVVARVRQPDQITAIQRSVRGFLRDDHVDLVVTMGGTGVTPDDVTPEAVEPLLDRQLPGFGERFRATSVSQIGERVIASRATAGVADGVPIFCVPGSEPAVRLAMTELILPVGGHLAGLAARDG